MSSADELDAAGGTVMASGTGTATPAPERPTRSWTGSGTGTSNGEPAALLDHEKLLVYGVARELVVLVNAWLARKMPRELHDQLERSTMSILSNIGEGAGKTSRPDKRRYYEIARGSASEAATQLDLLQIKGVISTAEYQRARLLLVRVIQMLSRLCLGPRTP